jgi:hypothetical protein
VFLALVSVSGGRRPEVVSRQHAMPGRIEVAVTSRARPRHMEHRGHIWVGSYVIPEQRRALLI